MFFIYKRLGPIQPPIIFVKIFHFFLDFFVKSCKMLKSSGRYTLYLLNTQYILSKCLQYVPNKFLKKRKYLLIEYIYCV